MTCSNTLAVTKAWYFEYIPPCQILWLLYSMPILFRDPNKILTAHNRTTYIVMASQRRAAIRIYSQSLRIFENNLMNKNNVVFQLHLLNGIVSRDEYFLKADKSRKVNKYFLYMLFLSFFMKKSNSSFSLLLWNQRREGNFEEGFSRHLQN